MGEDEIGCKTSLGRTLHIRNEGRKRAGSVWGGLFSFGKDGGNHSRERKREVIYICPLNAPSVDFLVFSSHKLRRGKILCFFSHFLLFLSPS